MKSAPKTTAQVLYEQAKSIAVRATPGKHDNPDNYMKQMLRAHRLAAGAAALLARSTKEPTRSSIHLFAARIAMEVQSFEEAERIARRGLNGALKPNVAQDLAAIADMAAKRKRIKPECQK